MNYTCGVCSKEIRGGLVDFKDHTDQHIIDIIKKKNPDWVDGQGVCQKCYEYFEKQLKG